MDTFPTEAAGTYYVPSTKSRNPTGKLLSAYTNLRHTLANVGIIARETRHLSNIAESQVAEEVLVEVSDAIMLIRSEVDVDHEQIMDAWKMTHEIRQRDLKSLISTSEYMNRYPVLKQINGHEFVSFLSFSGEDSILKIYFFTTARSGCSHQVSFAFNNRLQAKICTDFYKNVI